MTSEEHADTIYTNVKVCFGWRDRLRILFGRPAWLHVEIDCEHLPGRCQSRSSAWVAPLGKGAGTGL